MAFFIGCETSIMGEDGLYAYLWSVMQDDRVWNDQTKEGEKVSNIVAMMKYDIT